MHAVLPVQHPRAESVLNLMLYGCEIWVLTAPLRQRLNTFHNRRVHLVAGNARQVHRNDMPDDFV
jgi:hypothetical protein